MNNAIFIPEKMKVGFQNRQGTFTGKLAYIIYYDNKGKLRKETSWQNWRDKGIDPIDFDNEPIEGFCINKKVGGYDTGWNHRLTYCRIYDPRGYEFEINIENLLYILENTNSIKGKGLEGKFVYGMNGKDLILIPCESPDYKQLKEFNDKLRAGIKFNMKNVIKGATYLNAKNEELVYVGRYEAHHDYKKNKKEYFFYDRKARNWRNDDLGEFTSYASVGKTIIECIDENCCADYASIFDKFEYYESYNPYDPSKDEYFDHTVETLTRYVNNEIEKVKNNKHNPKNFDNIYYFVRNGEHEKPHETYNCKARARPWARYTEGKGFRFVTITQEEYKDNWSYRNRMKDVYNEEYISIEEFINRVKPQYKKEYLRDGKLRKEIYYDKH